MLVFTGRHSADANGGRRFIEQAALEAGRETVRFSDIEAEPAIGTIEKMTALIRQEKPAAVIALGGGSAMDAAKAAYLSAQSGWPLAEHFGVNRYSERCPDAAADRVICIPTTSGTGSEATPYSNIVDPAQQVKKLIAERLIVPELALLVPELTNSMPETVTRATGCDALAHSIEGFLNVRADRANPDADGWAFESIRLITENLPRAIADGRDETARRNMCIAATLGGMVIRFKPTGLPHLASYSWFGRLEHGIAVAMLLPGLLALLSRQPVRGGADHAARRTVSGQNAGGSHRFLPPVFWIPSECRAASPTVPASRRNCWRRPRRAAPPTG